jgi:hypothetical protein
MDTCKLASSSFGELDEIRLNNMLSYLSTLMPIVAISLQDHPAALLPHPSAHCSRLLAVSSILNHYILIKIVHANPNKEVRSPSHPRTHRRRPRLRRKCAKHRPTPAEVLVQRIEGLSPSTRVHPLEELSDGAFRKHLRILPK